MKGLELPASLTIQNDYAVVELNKVNKLSRPYLYEDAIVDFQKREAKEGGY